MRAHQHAPSPGLRARPFGAPHPSAVTGSLPAGTAARWPWSNPPGRTAGTRRCASRRAPASSTAASVHGGRPGSRGRRASGSPSPPAPAPHGCSCLGGGGREERNKEGRRPCRDYTHIQQNRNNNKIQTYNITYESLIKRSCKIHKFSNSGALN